MSSGLSIFLETIQEKSLNFFSTGHQMLFNFFNELCFYRDDGSIIFLTKGDNNSVDDRGLYAPGQLWLQKKDVVGRARG